MVQLPERRNLMSNHMRCPVLRNSDTNEPVEPQCRAPHQIGANIIIHRLCDCFGSFFNQRQQQTFCKAVLHFAIGRISQILFNDMDKRIDYPVCDLFGRQGVRLGGI